MISRRAAAGLSFPALAFALLLAGTALSTGSCALRGSRSTDEVERVKVFLIAPGGAVDDCRDDRAMAVEVVLPRRQPALEGALSALLRKRERIDTRSGLVNALYASPLRLRGIERSENGARIHFDGYLELGDGCDAARLRLQLERTAGQFRDLDRLEMDVGGRPLDELLAEAERKNPGGGQPSGLARSR